MIYAGVKPVLDVLSAILDPSSAFDRKRYGLNSLASCPQLEASICNNCTGTTSTALAGMVTPVSSLKSGEVRGNKLKNRDYKRAVIKYQINNKKEEAKNSN